MGPVESGVRTTLTKLGVLEPVEALECMAINLAQTLDVLNSAYVPDSAKFYDKPTYGKDDKIAAIATISRELRLTLEQIEATPRSSETDNVQRIADKY